MIRATLKLALFCLPLAAAATSVSASPLLAPPVLASAVQPLVRFDTPGNQLATVTPVAYHRHRRYRHRSFHHGR